MEYQKPLNCFSKASDSRFTIRKYNIINSQSNSNFSVGKKIIYGTEVIKSNLCDYDDAYILERNDIAIIGRNFANEVVVKICAPFIKCITKFDGLTIDDTKELDLVMPMLNLLEYSLNYSDTTCNLWFCFLNYSNIS